MKRSAEEKKESPSSLKKTCTHEDPEQDQDWKIKYLQGLGFKDGYFRLKDYRLEKPEDSPEYKSICDLFLPSYLEFLETFESVQIFRMYEPKFDGHTYKCAECNLGSMELEVFMYDSVEDSENGKHSKQLIVPLIVDKSSIREKISD